MNAYASPSPSPLPSREGKFMKFPLPLWERVRLKIPPEAGVRGM